MMEAIRERKLKQILKPKAYKDFMESMNGQAVSMDGIYVQDFIKWMLYYTREK